jgi:hypothetical protein
MQDRGMRDAGVGGDFQQPDCVGPAFQQTTLGGVEDRDASLRRAGARC